jgi:hypothetical protein
LKAILNLKTLYSCFSISLFCALVPFATLASADSPESITIWQRNFEDPFLKASVNQILDATVDEYGEYKLVASPKMEQADAFKQLAEGKIDIVIGSINLERESRFSPVLIPIDRGLAGFRICLIHEDSKGLAEISMLESEVLNEITIGIGNKWPDKSIYEQNKFTTLGHDQYLKLFDMLENKEFDCLSRSMQEVDAEILMLKDRPIKKDKDIVFIYPNGAFIYTQKGAIDLHKRITRGAEESIESKRYFELFDEHYSDILKKNNLYFRKMIVMSNRDISPQALEAISQYGLASFTFQQVSFN